MKLDLTNVRTFLEDGEIDQHVRKSLASLNKVMNKSGEGSDFLGWYDIPLAEDYSLGGYTLDEIHQVANEIREKDGTLVCVGIGGSYLGHKMVIEALRPYTDRILYAGHNISADHLQHVLDVIDQREEVYINPISKSGTTTEPGIAFRVLRDWLENRYGKSALSERIIATTDTESGALRELADQEGLRTFPVPGNVGGRYSVLTPVGLFPIATAGIDIDALLDGASEMAKQCTKQDESNPALQYAALRSTLYKYGKAIEILSTFSPRLQYFAEWWKQLAGESEGKDGKGLFPASAVFSTDLHSLGQWIQDGPRNIIETFLIVENSMESIHIKEKSQNADNLNYLAGKSFDEINRKAYEGTAKAHTDGDVPNLTISIDSLTEQSLGGLIFFFEMAVAITGYELAVNPFDQPGVEAYKTNMFRLLGKPGV